jgi:ABC-type lipoprotein release transport system permease subunit
VALATAAAAIAALLPARRATRVPVVTALADP